MSHHRHQLKRVFFILLSLGIGVGCAATRFKDQPIVWKVDDARHIAEPEEIEFFATEYFTKILATRRGTRSLEIPNRELAHNINALDEVPDSTWFTNRIGRRDISPTEAARGPATGPPPVPPFVVVSGKSGGGNPGFIIEDKKGRRFIIKFDTKENPEMQTGGNVVVSKIFWSAGYNVPADYVFEFRGEQLTVSKKATVKDALLRKQPLTKKLLGDILATASTQADGSYRATASMFLDGVPRGGWEPEGTRPDDANDTIAHEHRRELRGLRVLSAWVNHTDMKQDNTLDMYVTEGKRSFLRHYLLDFGEALGGHPAEKNRPEDGYEHIWGWDTQFKALFALGLWKRTWEDTVPSRWPAIGWFTADRFDPRTWREAYPYWPFHEMDASDAFWAAKIVMRFTRPMLKAIVAEAQYSAPEASAFLVDALDKRRMIIGVAFLEAVTPIDALRISDKGLCGYDLSVHYGIANGGVVERLNRRGEVIEAVTVDQTGKACLSVPKHDRYTVVRLRTRRGGEHKPVMQVHLKGGSQPRILGIVRVE